ncbi:MAG: hypothetical protein WC840_01565 [Candidatus Peribacteraceae bacterium]
MSFKQKTALAVGIFLVALPSFAAGTSPPNVKQIGAELKDGALTVTWALDGGTQGIAFYRLYFSRVSILENNGNYDDFQQTTGPETTYVFPSVPVKGNRIFLSVLAVNKAGLESEGFETEVTVDLKQGTAPQKTPTQGEASAGTTAQPMTIVSVTPVSATGILVTFSKLIAAGADITPRTFAISDTGGTVLAIIGAEVKGETVLLSVQPQVPEKGYLIGLLQNVPAADGTNATSSLPPTVFRGFLPRETPSPAPQTPPIPYGKNPFLAPPASQTQPYGQAPALPPEDPAGLLLKAVRQRSGLFSVLARWAGSIDSRRTLESYVLYTSNDGARFDRNSVVGRTETSVQFNRIPPGTFGLRVASRDARGNESAGIQKVIVLPASGIGLLGLLTASGMLAGQRLRRRKETSGNC